MASKDVISMMRSNGAPFPDSLLQAMSDNECWQWMYATKPKKPKAIKQPPQRTVCFTGFTLVRKEELTTIAVNSGWRVLKKVGPTMSHLCTGETPGPAKIEQALGLGAKVVAEAEFLALL
jgi:NAD-dependent DNA ligase